MKSSQEWFRREPAIIVSLLVLSAALFVVTYLVTSAFHREQVHLAGKYFAAGQAAVASAQPATAIEDFHTALLYQPGNQDYRFKLAQALALAGRNKEALSHFLNLWESEPGDGEVNLEIARLAMRMNEPAEASRFFHGAIYGVWNDSPEQHRLEARIELAKFLLSRGAFGQADAELVALSAELPDNTPLRLEVGSLFTQAGDLARALEQFRTVLASNRNNVVALTGAGHAAFELGQYQTAASYLTRAAGAGPLDSSSQNILHISQLVLESDPFRRGLSSNERAARVAASFEIAGGRMRQCASLKDVDLAPPAPTASTPLARDYAKWRELQPKINVRDLRRAPDFMEGVMNLVFQIESDTEQACGPPAGRDLALLLISRGRSGAEK